MDDGGEGDGDGGEGDGDGVEGDGDGGEWDEMAFDIDMDPNEFPFDAHNNDNHTGHAAEIPASQENVRNRVNERRKGKTVVVSHPNMNGIVVLNYLFGFQSHSAI